MICNLNIQNLSADFQENAIFFMFKFTELKDKYCRHNGVVD